MKVFTIFCIISLLISALSLARNLSDEAMSNEDIVQKFEELERQNTEMQSTIAKLLEEAIARDKTIRLQQSESEYWNRYYDKITKENSANISTNTNDIIKNDNEIQSNRVRNIINSNKIANIEENADQCFNDYLLISGDYCGDWKGATLKKIPLWENPLGEQHDEITFEWPTQQMWADMSPEVKLQSMSFQSIKSGMNIKSVNVTLSNGDTSQYQTNIESVYNETINFDPDVQIGLVEVVDNNFGYSIVKFYDRQGKEIATYNPWIWGLQNDYQKEYGLWSKWHHRVEYKIEENEELIGVYGTHNLTYEEYGGIQQGFLSNLGFIVKVKQSE